MPTPICTSTQSTRAEQPEPSEMTRSPGSSPGGNRGGFRVANRSGERRHALAVLYSTLADSDWPDHLDLRGRFTYYGDNKHPGHELHQTHRGGNRLLRLAFEATHSTPSRRRALYLAVLRLYQRLPREGCHLPRSRCTRRTRSLANSSTSSPFGARVETSVSRITARRSPCSTRAAS